MVSIEDSTDCSLRFANTSRLQSPATIRDITSKSEFSKCKLQLSSRASSSEICSLVGIPSIIYRSAGSIVGRSRYKVLEYVIIEALESVKYRLTTAVIFSD